MPFLFLCPTCRRWVAGILGPDFGVDVFQWGGAASVDGKTISVLKPEVCCLVALSWPRPAVLGDVVRTGSGFG